VNFAERFYGHTALSGFGEVNLTLNGTHSGYEIIPDVKITTRPRITIGQLQTSVLKQKQR
jgi:hypothetical protein